MHKTACFSHTFCDGIKKNIARKKQPFSIPAIAYKLDTANLARAPTLLCLSVIRALETYVYDRIIVESEGF